ncbi:hypothetical protein IKS57_03940 [bacterium]|nr:hypothetical protein [bacterium]
MLALALVLSGKEFVTNSGDAKDALTGLSPFDVQNLIYTGHDKTNLLKDVLVVTPSTYRNYEVNYTTPGGLLIIGEGFASLTSAIVL